MSTGRKHKQYLARAYAMGGSTLHEATHARQAIDAMFARMSYSAIARATGTSHSYIRRIHNGEIKRISPAKNKAIIAAFNHQPTDTSHVAAHGARRRLQALNAMGYTWTALAAETGYSLTGLKALVYGRWDVIEAANEQSVRAAYERLSMRLPVGSTSHERSAIGAARNSARRKGWPPPLAWDNIDDPDEQPVTHSAVTDRTDVDPIVIERIIGGDASLARAATWAEREAIVRRWRADGRPLNELERLTGWQPRKYLREDAA